MHLWEPCRVIKRSGRLMKMMCIYVYRCVGIPPVLNGRTMRLGKSMLCVYTPRRHFELSGVRRDCGRDYQNNLRDRGGFCRGSQATRGDAGVG